MRVAVEIVGWLLAAALGYFVAIAVAVTAGTLYASWIRRGTRKAMDDAQTLAFGEIEHSLPSRAWGVMIESACQAFALVLQTLYTLRVLPLLEAAGTGTPVVVLPGYSENAGTMWWLGRRLALTGFKPILLDFPSTMHRIEDNAAFLGERIAAIRAQHGGEPVAIVAHSMGGLVTRTLVHSLEDHGVCALVAIASPFRGTHLAAIGARLRMGHSVHQMSPKHDFHTRFPPSLAAPMPLLSLVGRQETIVSPEWSVVIAGAQVRVLDEPYGHMAPLFLASAFREIERWLLANGVKRIDRSAETSASK
jgi:pimeloyl-ACP methyl ester carboxylesterase